MLTSHEQSIDYYNFFTALNNIVTAVLKHTFKPEYIVTDSLRAIFNAANRVQSKCTTLMCYFHVKIYETKIYHTKHAL